MNDDPYIVARENRVIFALCVGITLVMIAIWAAPKVLRWYDQRQVFPVMKGELHGVSIPIGTNGAWSMVESNANLILYSNRNWKSEP